MRIVFFLLMAIVLGVISSCSDEVSSLEIDRAKKALVLGNASKVKRLTIEDGVKTVEYCCFYDPGKPFVLYFNKRNEDCMVINDRSVESNYIFKLMPKSEYTVHSYSRNSDRGPMSVVFKTDKNSDMIEPVR